MMVQVKTKRFTAEDYERMAEAGILHEDDHVELIRGEIVEMAAMGSRHAACVRRTGAQFSRHADGKFIVSVQNPIRLSLHSEPEPDIALLRPRADYYETAHPQPEDVLLVIEASDTSLPYDREVKVPLYAEAGIPELWIADLEHGRVEVFREPELGQYRHHEVVGRDGTLTPLLLPNLAIPVSAILG